jgi:TIR domain
MRIFLSYASERHGVAEGIALALRNAGHAVFLDRDDLPPGSSYDDRIRNAINASDLLVFLVSPESVSDGRYTLTELAFARKRWPSPQHRILPVEIAATPFDTVPNYLKAVTILQPQGNRGAEVAAAVADLGRRRTRWGWPTAGAAAVLGAVAVLLWHYLIDQGAAVEPLKVERLRAGLLGEAPTFQVFARLHNGGRAPLELTAIELETEPSERLLIEDWVLPETLQRLPPRSSAALAFAAGSKGGEEANVREWRLCARATNGGRTCSDWQDWRPQGAFKPEMAFVLSDELRHRAKTVASVGDGFALATTAPSALIQLSEDGTMLAQAELPGEPAALAGSGGAIFVATRSPNLLAAYGEGSLEPLWAREIRFAGNRPSTAFDEPPSTTPVSLAATARALWLLTGGGTGGDVIAYLNLTEAGQPDEHLTVPPYQVDAAFDLRDMHLVAAHDQIWGAVSNTTPASIYRFDQNAYHAFTGHDFDIVQCASDVTGGSGERLVIVDCDGAAVAIDARDSGIESVHQLGPLFDLKTGPYYWDTERVASDGAIIVGASNLSDRTGLEERTGTTIVVTAGGDRGTLLKLEDATTTSLALAGQVAIVVLESARGRREAIALKLRRPFPSGA